jgi:predicted N-acetyltransferase YhbS
MGLGELAVRPGRQRGGVGTALVQGGLERLRADGCVFSIVVGHATYYPRFGYRPGVELGLRCQWPAVPDGKFQALILDAAWQQKLSGTVRFDGIP